MFEGVIVLILWALFLALKVFALIDCVRRPAAAFPAVGRQSKWLWLALTGIAALTGLLPDLTLGIFGLAGLVAAIVYLVDVRPRIVEITGR